MKIILSSLLLAITTLGQSLFSGVDNVASDPVGACTWQAPPTYYGRLQYNVTNSNLWGCKAGTWTLINGTATSTVPSGTIILSLTACAAGYSEVAALNGFTVIGTIAANGDVGTTGGSNTITPSGTNSAPSFTGNPVTSSAVSAGTPAGTNSAPALTMNSYTPAGSNGTVAFTPAGTNNAPAFTGTAGQSTSSDSAGTPAGTNSAPTISYPANVPTFAGSSGVVPAETFTGNSGTVPAETFSGTPGTVPAETVSWPAGVPTFAGDSNTVPAETITWPASVPTAATESAHTHDSGTFVAGPSILLPKVAAALGNQGAGLDHYHDIAGTSGPGSAHTHVLSWPAAVPTNAATAVTPTGTISWPGGVPTNSTAAFTPAGTNGTVNFTPSGSNGTVNFTPSGTIAWPVNPPTATAPTFTGSALGTHSHTYTAAGTVAAPTFTGNAGTVPAETFTGTPATLTGTVAAPAFTGSALGTHTHTTTATGSVTAPSFTGNSADNRSAFVKVIFCSKT